MPLRAGFFTPIHTRPGAHPASYTGGTGLFPGIKQPKYGVYHPLPSSAEVQESGEWYFYSPSDFMAHWRVNFTFYWVFLIFQNFLLPVGIHILGFFKCIQIQSLDVSISVQTNTLIFFGVQVNSLHCGTVQVNSLQTDVQNVLCTVG